MTFVQTGYYVSKELCNGTLERCLVAGVRPFEVVLAEFCMQAWVVVGYALFMIYDFTSARQSREPLDILFVFGACIVESLRGMAAGLAVSSVYIFGRTKPELNSAVFLSLMVAVVGSLLAGK